MATPYDQASTLLTDLTDALRTVYHEEFAEIIPRFGRATNRLFKPSKRRIDTDGIMIQVKDRNLYGARTNTDINADFSTPRTYGVDKYTVTLSEMASANHLRRVDLSLQVTWMDLKRKFSKKSSATNFIEELTKQSMQNIAEHIAVRRHLDSTAKLGSVNGTPTGTDNRLTASATAIAATGGASFPVDGGSFAAFQPNMVLDRYTGATNDGKVIVLYTNARDNSVHVYGVNDSFPNGSSTINVNDIADNDDLYLSGEKDKNILSIGHWMSDPSTGDSFFGKDRTDPTNRYLLPHASGPTSSQQFVKTHLDDLSNQLGYIDEDADSAGYVALCQPELVTRYIQEIGQDTLIQYPNDDHKGKLLAGYGFDGNLYRHHTFGRYMLQGDALAVPNQIRFLRTGDWETLYAPTDGGENGWEWLPGVQGMWYRMPSITPGNGDTTTFRADGLMLMCDICLAPRAQAKLINITAT